MPVNLIERPTARPLACDECPANQCQFSRSRVYRYLLVMRQAHLAGESFEDVLRADVRSSRHIDPWLRGGGRGEAYARMVGLSLRDIRDRHGIDITNPHNADRVAAIMCPERFDESASETVC